MTTPGPCFQFDSFEVSATAFTVIQGGKRLDLEPKAIRVLIHLLQHRRRVVTKEELFREVWEGTAVTDNALTRIIAQLRRELGDDSRAPKYIETIPTLGYRFIGEAREMQSTTVAPAGARGGRPVARILGLSGVALAAVIGAGLWLWSASSSKAPGNAIPTQITTSPTVDARPSFGPDGQSFVYSSNQSGQFEIYRRDRLSNGQTVKVTANGKQNVHPAWSPDGKWIAYHSAADHGIWVVGATGGEPRRLTSFGSAPAWSPDSRSVVFASAEPFSLAPFDTGGPGNLWIAAFHGSGLRQITQAGAPPGGQVSPSWSHDGKRIVFVSLRRDSSIHVLDLSSGQSKQVMSTGVDIPRQPGTYFSRIWDPVFSPGDETIYFSAAGEKGQYSIWSIPSGGGTPRRIHTSPGATPTGLSLAPDGSRLLFTLTRSVSQLWTVEESGKTKPFFQEEVLRAALPSYSPGGQWIAFTVEMQGRNRNIWIMPAGGGQAAPVSEEGAPTDGGASWTPDEELLFGKVDGANTEFRGFHPLTRKTRILHKRSNTGIVRPVLMPNAKELLFSCSSPLNLCLGPLGPGTPRQLTFERGGASYPAIDRTGEWITYEVHREDTDQIGLMRSDGSAGRLLTQDPARNWPSSFSPDGKRIAYASFHQGVWNLWWINRESGERRQLTHETTFGSFVRSPVWRPGSEEVTYESFRVRGNIFALDLP